MQSIIRVIPDSSRLGRILAIALFILAALALPAFSLSISSISPNTGSTAGGQTVIITGTGFTGVTSVYFDGSSATFTVNSATQITAVTPANFAGAVSVTIYTSSANTMAQNAFTYAQTSPPSISGISPNTGSTAGGQTVIIRGSNLNGVTSVYFGGSRASFTVNSATQITAVTPANSPGPVTVTLYTASQNTALANAFTYVATPAPKITGISPNTGSTAGGQTVVITGTGFNGVTSVYFDGSSASFTVNSATQITAVTPANVAGQVTVTLYTASQNTALPNAFTYVSNYVPPPPPAPAIAGVSPNSGSTAGGDTVVITGANLNGVESVLFGSSSATFTVNSAAQITAVTPPGTAGAVTVTVYTSSQNAALANAFTYVAPYTPPPPSGAPTITSVSPSRGHSTGGQTVTITGTNLNGATSVEFGYPQGFGLPVITSDTPTQITVTLPPHSPGPVDVNVTTPLGSAGAAGAYTYTEPPQPVIASVIPNSGPLAGGQEIVITGTNFYGVEQVSIGQNSVYYPTSNPAGPDMSYSAFPPPDSPISAIPGYLAYNATEIILTTPAMDTPGAYQVYIYTTYHAAVGGASYTYVAAVAPPQNASNATNASINYDALLAKVAVGTSVPAKLAPVVSDGEYQVYVVTQGTDMNACTYPSLKPGQIKYEATITIAGGVVSKVTSGTVSGNPNMEICTTDQAITDLEKSSDPATTANQELQDNNLGYTVDNFIQRLEIGILSLLNQVIQVFTPHNGPYLHGAPD